MRTSQNWNEPCPNKTCTHYGQKNQGNISSIATYMPQSGKRRIVMCKTCGQQCSETRAPVFFDLRTPEENVMNNNGHRKHLQWQQELPITCDHSEN